MVTLLLYTVLALVAVGCLYGLALVFLSAREQMSPAAADRPPWNLGDEPLEPNDVVGVRLPVTLRGYRFAETDLLLDRLTEELRLRDDEIARLRSGADPAGADPNGVPVPAYSAPYPPAAYVAPVPQAPGAQRRRSRAPRTSRQHRVPPYTSPGLL